MAFPAAFVAEQAKEDEDVTGAYAVPMQVRLRDVALPEQASAREEHRVFMAEMIGAEATARRLLDEIAKPDVTVGGHRFGSGRDRQRHRAPPYDGRR